MTYYTSSFDLMLIKIMSVYTPKLISHDYKMYNGVVHLTFKCDQAKVFAREKLEGMVKRDVEDLRPVGMQINTKFEWVAP